VCHYLYIREVSAAIIALRGRKAQEHHFRTLDGLKYLSTERQLT
jgi:hypothetical protein